MLASAAIAPLNHMLRGESWARKRLQPSAGKTARFRVPPFFDLAVVIQPTGEVAAASTVAGNDAILTIMPALLPRLLVCDETAYREVRISGDSAFGQEILEIGQNLRWDVEQGYVTAEAARASYGVVVDPATMKLDEAATEKLRASMREAA